MESSRIADEDWCGDDLGGRSFEGVEFVRVDLAETRSDGGTVFDVLAAGFGLDVLPD